MIPAILERNASNVQAISLRIRGVQSNYTGQLAGQRIQSTLAFAFSQPCEALKQYTPPAEHDLVWQAGRAELEGRPLEIVLAHGVHASYFRSAEAEFWVDVDGNTAELTRCNGDPLVWLFGPMLILALARRGIFCLHSSAVQLPAGALVLIGASGAGKSTFARTDTAARLCDDISPVAHQGDRLVVLPQFPQLKLGHSDPVPETAQIAGLLYLQAAIADQPQSIAPMASSELHRQLLAHTVASRLFTPSDCQRWWGAIAKWLAQLDGRAFTLRPTYDAQAPDRAMLAALNSVVSLF